MKALNYRRDVKCGLCHTEGVVARMTVSMIGTWGRVTKQVSQANLCPGCLKAMGEAMHHQEAKR